MRNRNAALLTAALLLATPVSVSAQKVTAQTAAWQQPGSGMSLMQPGDRIILSVEGERPWTDTFVVKPGPVIDLPWIGSVPLAGVARSDVQTYLATQIGRYLKNPIVRATPLVRVTVLGEVAKPGFYDLPPDAPLADAITNAGGPTRDAALTKLHVDRAGATIQQGKQLHTALDRGATMSELGMQGGDEIIVPRSSDTERTVRIVSVIVGVPLAILTLLLLRPR